MPIRKTYRKQRRVGRKGSVAKGRSQRVGRKKGGEKYLVVDEMANGEIKLSVDIHSGVKKSSGVNNSSSTHHKIRIEKFNMSKFNDVFLIIHQLRNYIKENQEGFNTMQYIIKKDHPLFASETSITDTIKSHIDNIYKETELQSIFDLIFTEGLFECLRSIKTQYAYFVRNNKEHIDILNELDSYGREIASYYEIFKRYVDYLQLLRTLNSSKTQEEIHQMRKLSQSMAKQFNASPPSSTR